MLPINAREYEKSIEEFAIGLVVCMQKHVLIFLNTLSEPVYVGAKVAEYASGPVLYLRPVCPKLVAERAVAKLLSLTCDMAKNIFSWIEIMFYSLENAW